MSNGDGNTDLAIAVQNGSTGTIYTFLSQGDGTLTPAITTTAALSDQQTRNVLAGDFNGDGLKDVAWVHADTAPVIDLCISQGNGSFYTKSISNLPAAPPSSHIDVAGDFNGSGIDDILSFSSSAGTLAYGQGAAFLRVASIQDGLGAKTSINYSPITSPYVYSQDGGGLNGFPNLPLRTAQYVASQTTVLNPGSDDRVTGYQYQDARYNAQGRGFLGFAFVAAQDQTTNGNSVNQIVGYHQDFPYIGKPYFTASDSYNPYDGSGLGYTHFTSYTWNRQPQSFSSNFVSLASTQTKDYELGSSSPYQSSAWSANNSYDAYGNPTSTTTTVYSGDIGATPSYTAQENRTIVNDGVNWILDRLTNLSVTRSASNAPSITRTASFGYDAAGLLNEETIEPSDSTNAYLDTTYTRDAFGNIKTATTRGYSNSYLIPRTETFAYSPDGRFRKQVCNALNQCTDRSFDPNTGNVLTETDPNNFLTTHSYDSFGRSAGASVNQAGVSASSTVTRFWCSGSSLCADAPTAVFAQETTATDGSTAVAAFDSNQRPVREAYLNGGGAWVERLIQYDSEGRLYSVSSPKFTGTSNTYWTTTTYDKLNRPVQVVAPTDQNHPTGSATLFAHNGLSTSVIDPQRHITTQVHTPIGELASVIDPAGNVLSYGYNAYGELTSTTDPANRVTSIGYDLRGRKTQMNDPAMGSWTYGYDSLGELISQTDARQQTITLSYDLLARPKARVASDYSYAWTWDTRWIGVLSDLRKIQNSNSAIVYDRSYTYTGFGAVNTDMQTIGTSAYTTSYGHDGQGRVNSLTYPNGFAVAIGYSGYGAESSIAQPGGVLFWTADAWDQWGEVYQETLGNGVVNGIYRDAAVGAVQSIVAGRNGGSAVGNLAYDWDQNSNTAQRVNLNANNQTETFTYDNLDRLSADTVTNPSPPTATVTLSGYDALGNLGNKSGSPGYLYGSRTYAWTAENQLSQIGDSFLGQTSFQYGTDGDVVSQTSIQSGIPTTTQYLADGLAESINSGSGAIWNNYIPAPTGTVAMVVQSPTRSDVAQYLQNDSLGSVVAVSDGSGNVIQQYAYDPQGRRTTTFTASNYGGILTDWGYTGHLQLDTLNLVHMQGRVYDAVMGRFLSADPFIQAPDNLQSHNRYAYVSNNPLTYVDPSGFDECIVISCDDFASLTNVGIGVSMGVDNTSEPGTTIVGDNEQPIGLFLTPWANEPWMKDDYYGNKLSGSVTDPTTASLLSTCPLCNDAGSNTPGTFNVGVPSTPGGPGANVNNATTAAGSQPSGGVTPNKGTNAGNEKHANGMATASAAAVTQPAWKAAQNASVAALRAQGKNVIEQVSIRIFLEEGSVEAIADYAYVEGQKIIIGEVKDGLEARFTTNQKAVYKALINGRVAFSDAATAALRLSPGIDYKVAGLTVNAMAGSRALRQMGRMFGVNAKGAVSILRVGGAAFAGASVVLDALWPSELAPNQDCPGCLANGIRR